MSDEGSKISLQDLPIEVLLDNILPFTLAHDIPHLGCTNKFFASLCNDDTLWKRKLLDDFNFSGDNTARTSGFKLIYRGLDKPRVFVWGEKGNGRLGSANIPKSVVSGVPYPIQVSLPGVRVVSLVAGGMSFHALDSEGNVYVWGTLDGQMYTTDSAGFSESAKSAKVPHKLALPAPIRSISCGRLHSSCLDNVNRIWTFTNWGRPFYLSAPLLRDPDYAPKQIECGWAFSALLTKSGDVFVWWPFIGATGEIVELKMQEMDAEGDKKSHADEHVIPCVTWGLDVVPIRLPTIPPLPEILDSGVEEKLHPIVLIQIAALDNVVVGLTNQGHVLKYSSLRSEVEVPNGRWEYLPRFSELSELGKLSVFSASLEGASPRAELPKAFKITHISANFQTFVAYSTESSSIVLLGDTATGPLTEPRILPELQNKSIISVVIGDYHNAALTAGGKLLTWGAYSSGALGLGEPTKLEPGTPGGFADHAALQFAIERRRGTPPAVGKPTEVRFDHGSKTPKERFCFAVTAAGWHTGALVIDLEQPGADDEVEVQDQVNFPSRVGNQSGIRFGLPTVPPSIFRLGHAAGGSTS